MKDIYLIEAWRKVSNTIAQETIKQELCEFWNSQDQSPANPNFSLSEME